MSILAKRTLLTRLSISCWTGRKIDKEATKQTAENNNAEKTRLKANKYLMADNALKSITKAAGAARNTFMDLTLAWADTGGRLLPTTSYISFMQTMGPLRDDFNEAVASFVLNYERLVQEQSRFLGDLYNEADYPSLGNIRSKFDLDLFIGPCPDKNDFRVDMAEAQMQALKDDVEKRCLKAEADAKREVYGRVIERISKLSEGLASYAPRQGEERVKNHFRDTLVGNIRDLVDLMPNFNLDEDPAFDGLIQEIRDRLCAEDPQELRDNQIVRQQVRRDADDILRKVQQYMN